MVYMKPTRRRACPVCGKDVGIKLDGYPYKHGTRFGCPGSGVRVAGNRRTADPVLSRPPER